MENFFGVKAVHTDPAIMIISTNDFRLKTKNLNIIGIYIKFRKIRVDVPRLVLKFQSFKLSGRQKSF